MTDVIRCHKCQRVVRDGYSHEANDCENWPEWVKGVSQYAYREYVVIKIEAVNWEITLAGVVVGYKISPNDCFAFIDRLEA